MVDEKFVAFFFTTLFIFGILLSITPAYIAFKRGKSFWTWWIFTASVFSILLFILIKAQAISTIIYLLGILPVASILALHPRVNITLKTNIAKDAMYFFSILAILLVVAIVLYLYFWYPKRTFLGDIEEIYFVSSAVVFLVACLGFSLLIFIMSERRRGEIMASVLLTSLLALPVFLKPSRAYAVGNALSRIIGTNSLFGPIINDLAFHRPIAGVFVLLGISAGCAAITIRLNDKYNLASAGVAIILAILNFVASVLPVIRLSKSSYLSSYILAGLLLVRFLLPRLFVNVDGVLGLLLLVPFIISAFIIGVIGTVLSSIVIAASIKQGKYLAGIGILSVGLLTAAKDVLDTVDYASQVPVLIVIFYGSTSGIVSLILWVISDYRAQIYHVD